MAVQTCRTEKTVKHSSPGGKPVKTIVFLLFITAAIFMAPQSGVAQTLNEQRSRLLELLGDTHQLTSDQSAEVGKIFSKGTFIGQGNPKISRHPASSEECREMLNQRQINYDNLRFEQICGAKYMAPLFDPEKETAEDARVCIDKFEFPNIPCEYPVVWVRTREAAEICLAMGKRICDAHEWEGGCAGQLRPPDYRFDLTAGISPGAAVKKSRKVHNSKMSKGKTWSYGPQYRKGICGANSSKSPGCQGGGWNKCGSNTYPSGFFPDCRSPLGVYDINGNAAEHMNLPLDKSQMASRGSTKLGYTEMKGSWFIFDKYRAHQDWCRWRAPYWHGSRVMSPKSHHNYHLGFRCCKTVQGNRNVSEIKQRLGRMVSKGVQ